MGPALTQSSHALLPHHRYPATVETAGYMAIWRLKSQAKPSKEIHLVAPPLAPCDTNTIQQGNKVLLTPTPSHSTLDSPQQQHAVSGHAPCQNSTQLLLLPPLTQSHNTPCTNDVDHLLEPSWCAVAVLHPTSRHASTRERHKQQGKHCVPLLPALLSSSSSNAVVAVTSP